jgi:hypothetical protein
MTQIAQDVESVMEAFYTSMVAQQSAIGALTITRIWQPWDQLSAIAQPAIIIVEPSEQQEQTIAMRSKVRLNVQLVCYIRVDNADVSNPPSKILNDFIRKIRTAILPQGRDIVKNTNTLGGLAAGVFVNGKIIKDAGVLDEQASLLIPVTIILP